MKEFCYLNGKIVRTDEAKISITDIGVLRGYAIFDSIAGAGKKIIFFDEHFKRFQNSAKIMKLKIPLSKEKIEKIINTLLIKNGYGFSKIRLVLTGGELIGGLEYDFQSPTFFILVQKLDALKKSFYKDGGKLILHEYQREIPRAKSNNYLVPVSIDSKRKTAKAIEILFTSHGKVLECSTSNFFIIKNGKLITSKNDILLGITRSKVIGLGKKFMKVEERDIKISELKTADEAFITSSYKKVLPIVKIGNMKIGGGKVGPKTKILMEAYERLEEIEKNK